MPWDVKHDSRCPSSRPWGVVKQGDNELEGCHSSRADAEDQQAALYAAEADQELAKLAEEVVQVTTHNTMTTITGPLDQLGGKPNQGTPADHRLRRNRKRMAQVGADGECPPGHHLMPDGDCMPDEEMPGMPGMMPGYEGDTLPWSGVLALEGVETGDGREFAADSLEWADPPLPLLWQRESQPQHERSVVVGRIDALERVTPEIRGRGVLDLGSPEGLEVARQMGYDPETGAIDSSRAIAGGISVDVDSVKDSDVELVFPDSGGDVVEEDEGGDLLMLFGPPPEKVVFHRGRLRGATLVALPAFVEARINLDEGVINGGTNMTELAASLLAARTQELGAIGSHSTGTSDDSWDASAATASLPSPMPVATARGMYAWMASGAVQDGEVRKADLKFPHHNSAGGAANLTACSAGIGALNGARGGSSIPAADRQGVYNHLARHLRDAGREPPALAELDDALVAAGAVAVAPPATWFENPGLRGPTALVVQDSGRLFGHLALWGVCHTSFADRCVTPPRERDYPYFTLGDLKTSEGQVVGVGQVTLGTGHFAGLGAGPAIEHYDHTGHAVADITVGEDRYGIWVAGALRPGVSEERVRELRAAKLSGDWRKIAGQLRLVAVLAVNVPGYPVPRMRVRYDNDGLVSLTAAGVVTEEREHAYEATTRDGYGTLRVRKVKS